jgi:CheY-like chemotaxis protein
MGMAPEQLTRAIEPFYTTKGSKHGSGLGLSMVFGFCEQAGGRFGLASEPGAGTKATILLPLNGRVDREMGETSEASPRTASAATTGKVLLVEDEERVRKLAGRYLRDLGYDLLTAENGERAIEVLRSVSAIKLVFSDIVMPGEINGYDLYWLIRRQWPETKVLLTTGLRSEEIDALAGAVESPVPIALSKPYTKEQLAEAIRTLFAA